MTEHCFLCGLVITADQPYVMMPSRYAGDIRTSHLLCALVQELTSEDTTDVLKQAFKVELEKLQ